MDAKAWRRNGRRCVAPRTSLRSGAGPRRIAPWRRARWFRTTALRSLAFRALTTLVVLFSIWLVGGQTAAQCPLCGADTQRGEGSLAPNSGAGASGLRAQTASFTSSASRLSPVSQVAQRSETPNLYSLAAPAPEYGPSAEPLTPGQPALSQLVWGESGLSATGGGCSECGGGGPLYDEGYTAPNEPVFNPWPAFDRFATHLDGLLFRVKGYPRNIGRGQPLVGTSWLNRPYYAGWFMGTMWGDGIINGQLKQNNDFFGGYRLGWDPDYYWGVETRLAFAEMNLKTPENVRLSDTNDLFLADVSLLYYPWGDSRWRPYALVGLGFGHFHFQDAAAVGHNATLLGLPIGLGVKYQYRRWLAARFEALDNIAFANDGLDTMHNVSLTLGVEVRWGVHPRSYWPWQPSRHIW